MPFVGATGLAFSDMVLTAVDRKPECLEASKFTMLEKNTALGAMKLDPGPAVSTLCCIISSKLLGPEGA